MSERRRVPFSVDSGDGRTTASLAKTGGLWYNIVMVIKKANKTVNIKKPENLVYC
jgi:hypothetical protein